MVLLSSCDPCGEPWGMVGCGPAIAMSSLGGYFHTTFPSIFCLPFLSVPFDFSSALPCLTQAGPERISSSVPVRPQSLPCAFIAQV